MGSSLEKVEDLPISAKVRIFTSPLSVSIVDLDMRLSGWKDSENDSKSGISGGSLGFDWLEVPLRGMEVLDVGRRGGGGLYADLRAAGFLTGFGLLSLSVVGGTGDSGFSFCGGCGVLGGLRVGFETCAALAEFVRKVFLGGSATGGGGGGTCLFRPVVTVLPGRLDTPVLGRDCCRCFWSLSPRRREDLGGTLGVRGLFGVLDGDAVDVDVLLEPMPGFDSTDGVFLVVADVGFEAFRDSLASDFVDDMVLLLPTLDSVALGAGLEDEDDVGRSTVTLVAAAEDDGLSTTSSSCLGF